MDLFVDEQWKYTNDEPISIIWCGAGLTRGVQGTVSFVVELIAKCC
jgi:hypothetical protein